MASFFSTSTRMTAGAFVGAIIAFTPALMSMAGDVTSLAGATVPVEALMSMESPAEAHGGTRVEVDALMEVDSSVSPASGGSASFTPREMSMALVPVEPSAGAWVSTVTDVEIVHLEPTSKFATTKDITTVQYTIKVPLEMAMHSPVVAYAGTIVYVDGQMTMILDDHGPVARPRRVDVQVIMS